MSTFSHSEVLFTQNLFSLAGKNLPLSPYITHKRVHDIVLSAGASSEPLS